MRRCWRPTSCSASATAGPTATPARVDVYTKGRKFVHIDIEPTQIGRVFNPDLGIVSDAERGARNCSSRRRASAKAAGALKDRSRLGRRMPRAQAHDAAAHAFRPDADQAAARLRGDEQGVRQGRPLCHDDRPVADRRRAIPARLQAAPLDQLRPGRPARLDDPGRARRARADPIARSSRSPATTTSSS